MELISIITPTYNSVSFVSNTIDSIINQTYNNWELLVTDDCSSDGTWKLLQSYSSKDNRIKIFKLSSNCGSAIARNNSLKFANGKYIAFCDSDDIWFPEKLAVQLEFMLIKNVPISFTNYEVWNEDLTKCIYTVKSINELNYTDYLKNTIIGMSTSMINKEIVGNFEFTNIRTRQDTYLWISLFKKGYKAYGINKILTKYVVRDNSISANKFKAAKVVWYLYYHLEELGLLKSGYYFLFYAINAVKKRL